MRFFSGAKNEKLAAAEADALIAQYGAFLAYEEARRRCKDPRFTFQDETGHWKRVTNILAARTGRPSRSLMVSLEVPLEHRRYVAVGQVVEVAFKTRPGEVCAGRVEAVQKAIASGQEEDEPDGEPGPFLVHIKLQDVSTSVSAGSTDLMAIFTDPTNASHVVLRQTAVLNHVN